MTTSPRTLLLVACAVLLAAGAAPRGLEAQSVLRRTPNLAGGWVGRPGAVHFNFLHRFNLVGQDNDVVVNTPTFLLSAPLPGNSMVGAHYASDSQIAGEVNEWELFGRWAPLRAANEGSPLDLSLTAAYNTAAGSGDGELSVGVPVGPLLLLGVGRVFSDAFGRGEAGWAAGGGAVLRLTDGIALAGDLVSVSDREEGETVAWGAGVQLRVPLTPHTLSLQATNTRTATLQGTSLGQEDANTAEDRIVWGFEFTIPFTFSRYFGGGGDDGDPGAEAPAADAPGGTVITMSDDLRFQPSTVRVRVGETVVWENPTQLVHTVTADPERAVRPESVSLPEGAATFDSGNLRPGESYRRSFDVPGEYVYFCVPHELAGMVGRIVVTPR